MFEGGNAALRTSCQHGYPVRVVRSHKEKRSAYAPTSEEGVRYDGVYRIEKCWRKPGQQGKLVCRCGCSRRLALRTRPPLAFAPRDVRDDWL